MTPAQKLRDLLAAPGIQVMPGCFDALSAKLVADAGFKVTFMSGFAVSAARLGVPDTGLISFGEMLDSLRNCCSAAAGIPLIGDGDTGYGNALNVQRTVVEYARAGAAADSRRGGRGSGTLGRLHAVLHEFVSRITRLELLIICLFLAGSPGRVVMPPTRGRIGWRRVIVTQRDAAGRYRQRSNRDRAQKHSFRC